VNEISVYWAVIVVFLENVDLINDNAGQTAQTLERMEQWLCQSKVFTLDE
jgi:DNA integrity scanning protein DisA with diadenylate cyclase activity